MARGIKPARHTRILAILVCKRSMREKVITGSLDFPKSGNRDDSGKHAELLNAL
jgi:hypothetical protein